MAYKSSPYLSAQNLLFLAIMLAGCQPSSKENEGKTDQSNGVKFKLITTDTFHFNNFVDCNMAEAWIGDTLRIFPGKYGEDPVWGYAKDLKFASGFNADEVFSTPADKYIAPSLPLNAPQGQKGLHGAIWFETVYQAQNDSSGRTLYAIYHNENYPETLPFNPETKEGYQDKDWPLGLTDRITPAAVPRIGVMKSTDGGWHWENKGLFLEDEQCNKLVAHQWLGRGQKEQKISLQADVLFCFCVFREQLTNGNTFAWFGPLCLGPLKPIVCQIKDQLIIFWILSAQS